VRFIKTVLVLGLLLAGVAGFFVLVPYGPSAETFVEIAPGSGTTGISAQLEKSGIIRSHYAFEAVRAWKSIAGGAGTLKAGEYRFDHAVSVLEVYDRIRRGDVFTISLSVPEGYNIFDIAGAVQAAGLGTRDEFLKAEMTHTELVRPWSPHATSVEGYLFPDTYKFGRHATPLQMLTTMVKRFTQQATHLGLTGTDTARLVTMASLVEKEVHVDSERPEVASVFENRLAADMPLQTDPAVIYASLLRGTWTGVIHQSELHSDSAYNTYGHKGLPPGPVCNPGIAALKAAQHPASTNYLYFVADANGHTKFATSLADHNANVVDYRKGLQ
jgi:UPF0755 protein